jgi:hypothetical protein
MELTLYLDSSIVVLTLVEQNNEKYCIVCDADYNTAKKYLGSEEILFTIEDVIIAKALLLKLPKMSHEIRFKIYETIIENKRGYDRLYSKPCYEYATHSNII